MIETEHKVTISAPIDRVWDYAKDIERWASLMPGLQECTLIDADNSRWTLKVGVGGLVRKVNVHVHVDQWDGPARVLFSYKLEGDPVEGGGAYAATRVNANETDVTFKVQVSGSGSMAPMWEAMGKPLLPQLAKAFAEQFKAAIETEAGAATAREGARSSFIGALWLQIQDYWRALFRPAS